MAKFRFEVLGRNCLPEGSVVGEDGEEKVAPLKKGDIVESDKPLDKLFANKYRRLDGPTAVQRDHDDLPDKAGKVMDDPNKLADEAARGKKKSKTVPTNEETVSGDEAPEVEEDEAEEAGDQAETEEADEAPAEVNVTDQFPKAHGHKLTVSKAGNDFIVRDKDGMTLSTGNKKAVSDFVRKFKKK